MKRGYFCLVVAAAATVATGNSLAGSAWPQRLGLAGSRLRNKWAGWLLTRRVCAAAAGGDAVALCKATAVGETWSW
jgi:hypothetical protein